MLGSIQCKSLIILKSRNAELIAKRMPFPNSMPAHFYGSIRQMYTSDEDMGQVMKKWEVPAASKGTKKDHADRIGK